MIQDPELLCKFIHVGDLHIGTKQYRSLELAKDYVQHLRAILNYAVKREVHFVMFAGDFFTSLEILPGLFLELISTLQDFKKKFKDKIQLIAIEGNHDTRRTSKGILFPRGQSWLKVLAKLNLITLITCEFDPEGRIPTNQRNTNLLKGCLVQHHGCKIYGTPYLRKNITENLHQLYQSIPADDDDYHILLQHFGIEGQMDNVPGLNYADIEFLHRKIDYLALGHFHLGYQCQDWVFNPGAVEAVSPGEYFYPRGIYFVEIRKNLKEIGVKETHRKNKFIKHIEYIKVPNRPQKWREIELLQKFSDSAALLNFISSKIVENEQRESNNPKASKMRPILHLRLIGTEPPNFTNNYQKIMRSALLKRFNYPDITIRTKFRSSGPNLYKFIPTLKKVAL